MHYDKYTSYRNILRLLTDKVLKITSNVRETVKRLLYFDTWFIGGIYNTEPKLAAFRHDNKPVPSTPLSV